jgi:hypothetical protein
MDLEDVEALRPFVQHGVLTTIPRKHAKRQVLLDWLAQSFEPGRHYTEVQVNEVLRVVYPDFATLRRLLIDEGFLDRDAGSYWRAGGSID